MTLLHVVGWSVVPCFYEGLPACLIFWGAQPPTFPCPALFLLLLVDHTVSTITTSAVNFICNILGMTEDLSQSLWTQNIAYSHVWQVLVWEKRCSAEMSLWTCPYSLYEPIIILVSCLWSCILHCFVYVCMYVCMLKAQNLSSVRIMLRCRVLFLWIMWRGCFFQVLLQATTHRMQRIHAQLSGTVSMMI